MYTGESACVFIVGAYIGVSKGRNVEETNTYVSVASKSIDKNNRRGGGQVAMGPLPESALAQSVLNPSSPNHCSREEIINLAVSIF